MLKHFLLNAFRQLWRNKIHSLINIASLATGLTVFAFAFLYVKSEISYDRSWPDADRIHRLTLEQRGLPGSADGVMNNVVARAYPSITDYFSNEIDSISRVSGQAARLKDSEEDSYWEITFVDEAFTDIFKLEVVEGNLDLALQQPGFIALSERLAERLGEEGVVGNTIHLESFQPGAEQRYEIAAIYRLPDHISSTASVMSLSRIDDYSLPLFGNGDNGFPRGWENGVRVWLTLKDGIDTDAFNAMQPQFIRDAVTAFDTVLGDDRNIEDHLFYTWQRVTDVHFNPVDIEGLSGNTGSMTRVITFGAIGILVLLVGCSNSISLSLASVIERRREIGIRKAAGAMPADISIHSLGESVLLTLLALAPAITALELLKPVFVSLFPFNFVLESGFSDYLLLLFIAVFIGLLNGAYPALLLSRIKPQAVLKVGTTEGVKRGQQLRTILVGVQFCLAAILLVGTAALFTQLEVTRRQPLGFSLDNLVSISLNRREQSDNGLALFNQLKSIPGVVGADISGNPPLVNFPPSVNSTNLVRYQNEQDEVRVHQESTGPRFFELTEIPVIAGRGFDRLRDTVDASAQASDETRQPQEMRVVINRSAARALDFDTPEEAVNARIYQRYSVNRSGNVEITEVPVLVIGVVEDSQVYSLQRLPGPELYRLIPEKNFYSLLLKYEDSVEATIQDSIREADEAIFGNSQVSIRFMEPLLDQSFRQERNESKLLLISAGLALLLSFIGLYGLVSITMRTQIKEVGVRKVLGATRLSIIRIFLTRFSVPVLIANVIAWPVAAYFVLQWIERFPYQLEKGWLIPICLVTSLLVLLIVWLTVGGLTLKAASSKPVTSLRYE